jgi:vitamin B12/bleomycin/antimicrobial peptide transport system ATP-binding/permease protein
MNGERRAITRKTLGRLMHGIAVFLRSRTGRKARLMLIGLFTLMICLNLMNVANSYVGRFFMTSIENRDSTGFVHYAWLFVTVFAGSTLVAVLFRYTEEHLGLLWRDWLTRRITGVYIERHLFEHFVCEDEISNPDQRMSEDVKQLTTTTLSFLLMIINASLTILSFSGVLWNISPKLFVVAVLYALCGSIFTVWLGRPLIRLNYQQSDCEANFRTELIQIDRDGDKIIATGTELEVKEKINERIDSLVSNLRRIIGINRNLNFFTTGYNYLIQLIPVLIVAPLFIQGKVEFGVIGQSAMAFAALLGAFSLIITQFQAISTYASVVARLSEFVDHAERCGKTDTSQVQTSPKP